MKLAHVKRWPQNGLVRSRCCCPSRKESCDLEGSQESGKADFQVGVRTPSLGAWDSWGWTCKHRTVGESERGLPVLDKIPGPGQRYEDQNKIKIGELVSVVVLLKKESRD